MARALLSRARMGELAVPKRRVPVTVTFAGGERVRVALFVSEAVPDHPGCERLGDLLEGESTFLPAAELEGSGITFLCRASLAVVEAEVGAECRDGDGLTIPTELPVEVTLADGERHRGWVSYALPPSRARLVDFLNDASAFLPLLGEGETVRFVHKRHVRRVDLLER